MGSPLRLRVEGSRIIGPDGQRVTLAGVNMYLEWYIRYQQTAFFDVRHLRERIPAANVVRFVALLWHDATTPEDGLECSTDVAAMGYMSHHCMTFIRAAVQLRWYLTIQVYRVASSTYRAPEHTIHSAFLAAALTETWAVRVPPNDTAAGWRLSKPTGLY